MLRFRHRLRGGFRRLQNIAAGRVLAGRILAGHIRRLRFGCARVFRIRGFCSLRHRRGRGFFGARAAHLQLAGQLNFDILARMLGIDEFLDFKR